MQRVESSNLHSHSYDPVEQKYSVLFLHRPCSGAGCVHCGNKGHAGQIYDYEGVPPEKWAKVRDAESKGKAFISEIKNWKHPETKEGFKFTKRPA